MSGVSAKACTTVGYGETGLNPTRLPIESWDGTSWSVAPVSSPGHIASLNGVSCVSAGACSAVGSRGNWRNRVLTFIDSGTAAG